MGEALAIQGGPRAVPEGAILGWPEVDDDDRQAVLASLAGCAHAFGPNCKAFQQEFAAWNGAKFALTVNSGTAALHMGLAAVGVQAGDEVIAPAYTWSSSATCALHHNAIPVFVDINFDTMNLDLDKLEAAITPRTKAIVAVHLHGLPLDMDRLMEIANRRGVPVVEDCCQAVGATWKGRKVGTFGACAAFSFNQNKIVCSGEGGMFTCDDPKIKARAEKLWYFGESIEPPAGQTHELFALGWMYRNNDLTAAFGRSQLRKATRNLAAMRVLAARLAAALEGTPGLILPREVPAGAGHNWYNFTVRFDFQVLGMAGEPSVARDRLVKALQAEGVPTDVWQGFILPAMTVIRAKSAYGKGCPWDCGHAAPVTYDSTAYPVARRHCDSHTGITFALRPPNGPGQVDLVAAGIRKVLAGAATF